MRLEAQVLYAFAFNKVINTTPHSYQSVAVKSNQTNYFIARLKVESSVIQLLHFRNTNDDSNLSDILAGLGFRKIPP